MWKSSLAQNVSTQVGVKISLDEESAPMTIEKNKILRAQLELLGKQPWQASPFASFLRRMNWFIMAI